MSMVKKVLEIVVQSYDEGDDTFEIGIPVYERGSAEHEAIPGCMNDAFDLDDLHLPAGLLAVMVGEFGEPHEFVGKKFIIGAPKSLVG